MNGTVRTAPVMQAKRSMKAKTDEEKNVILDIHEDALKYLAARSRTTGEIEDRLRSLGYGKDEIAKEMERLKDLRYTDDADYARRYLAAAFSKGRSAKRAGYELRKKGITEDAEDVIRDAEQDNDSERARALARGREVPVPDVPEGASYQERRRIREKYRAKVARTLAQLGYSGDVVFYVLDELGSRG